MHLKTVAIKASVNLRLLELTLTAKLYIEYLPLFRSSNLIRHTINLSNSTPEWLRQKKIWIKLVHDLIYEYLDFQPNGYPALHKPLKVHTTNLKRTAMQWVTNEFWISASVVKWEAVWPGPCSVAGDGWVIHCGLSSPPSSATYPLKSTT
jgi:hypothetical protein